MQSRTEILQEFMRGRNCAQCTLAHFADRADLDSEDTDRLTACFGGGLEMGGPCGAVVGALMAIGALVEDRETQHRINDEFRRRFAEKNGSIYCKELTGYDFSVPGQLELARSSGRIPELCPGLVLSAIEILEQLLEEEGV